MKKLTEAQKKALQKFADGFGRSAYTSKCRLNTLEALYTRGLISKRFGLGSMAFPRTAIEWTITTTGRAALEQEP